MFPEGRALEFLIAAVVALIVVGPKDLPVLLRKFGQFMAKVRSMAAEFRASFDEMARQSELDELRKEVEAMRKGQLADIATHAPEVNQAFDEISQGLSDVGVQLNSPVSYPYAAAETTIEVKPAPKPRGRKTTAKTPAKAAAAKKTAAPKTVAKAKAAVTKPPATKPAATKPTKAAAKAAPAKPRTRKATVS
jgi:sec-independent protein translocase protein TatB